MNSPKALPTHPDMGNPQLQPHKLGPCHPAQGTPGPCGLSEPCQAPGYPVQPWFPVAQLQLVRPLLIFPAQQLPPAVNELLLPQPLPARGRGPTAWRSRHPPCIRRAVVQGRDTMDVGAGLMMPRDGSDLATFPPSSFTCGSLLPAIICMDACGFHFHIHGVLMTL